MLTRNEGVSTTKVSRRTHEKVSKTHNMPMTERRYQYKYSCTCKSFHRSTWVCCHVLVVMQLDKTFDLYR